MAWVMQVAMHLTCSVVKRMTLSYSILDVVSVTNVKACSVCGGYTVLPSFVSQVNSLRVVIFFFFKCLLL